MLAHIFIFTFIIYSCLLYLQSIYRNHGWNCQQVPRNLPFRHGAELQAPQETVIQHHPGHKSCWKRFRRFQNVVIACNCYWHQGLRRNIGPKHAKTVSFLLQPVQPATFKLAMRPSTATCKPYVFQWLLGLHPAIDRWMPRCFFLTKSSCTPL